jgi:hypothetical protein
MVDIYIYIELVNGTINQLITAGAPPCVLEHEWMMPFHSVGNVIIPTDY